VLGALELRPRFRPVRDAEPTAWEGKWEVPLIEGDHQSETFVLARNKLFRLRVEEKVWDFHEGESVTVRWEPGKVFVNDIQVVPNPETRKVYPVSHIKKVYGNIPGVREYIAAHRGEASEDEVATRAVELWFEKKQNVVDKATKLYIELVKKRPPREAAEAASEVISESGLADSAVVSMANPPESEAQDVYLYWRGAGSGEMMSLVPWWREVAPPTVIAKRTYADLTHELDRLTYGGNTLKVGFEGGTLIIDGTVIAKPKGANQ
jgi:hypothetical protein